MLKKDLNWKLLIYPELYLGEEYYKGNIEIENGSIYDFLNLALKNLERSKINIYSTILGSIIYGFNFLTKYNLLCISCSKNFDSWFASSKEFEKLKKLKLVNCPNCKSFNVKKSLMSPSVINKKKDNNNFESKKYLEIKNKLKDYKNFI